MKHIPAVIPYYKAREKLEQCVNCLDKQNWPIDLFVRDNSDDNILFTKAINEGLRKFSYSDKYDYVLVLNQDAYLRTNCLVNLIEAMEANPTCGIACPVQYSKDEAITWHGSLDAFPFGVHAAKDPAAPTTPYETYWANGACMLIRTSMIREIGLLDENMLFVFSDSDYSFTARSRGWAVMVVPNAEVEHSLDGSGSSPIPDWLQKIKINDMSFFAKKWLTGALFRSLAYEGGKLTDIQIRNYLKECELALKKLPKGAKVE